MLLSNLFLASTAFAHPTLFHFFQDLIPSRTDNTNEALLDVLSGSQTVLEKTNGEGDIRFQFPNCPNDLPLSCGNSTSIENTCCFEYPGGIILQTQFWDYYPAVGPSDLFTLHGLWSDNCDGTYQQFCNKEMAIKNVTGILEKKNEQKLLSEMERIWKNFNGDDHSLWLHEFNKHGTCMSTFDPGCYQEKPTLSSSPTETIEKVQLNEASSSYTDVLDTVVVDFFHTAVNAFYKLPTFEFLKEEGIVPSKTKTYTYDQIDSALSKHFFGKKVHFSCNRFQALQEVWYYYTILGSVQFGKYHPIDAMGRGNCPREGIKFLPKDFAPPHPTNPGGPPAPGPTGTEPHGAIYISGHNGCLISNGKWYSVSSGSCATFKLIEAQFGGYNLKSNKGYCDVIDGILICGQKISKGQFTTSGSFIVYGGNIEWSSGNVPKGIKQVPVSPGKDGDVVFKLRFVGKN